MVLKIIARLESLIRSTWSCYYKNISFVNLVAHCTSIYIYILGVRIRIMLATFLRDITATFLSVTDTYIRTYAHHENRTRIRKLATLAIISLSKWFHIIRQYIIIYISYINLFTQCTMHKHNCLNTMTSRNVQT